MSCHVVLVVLEITLSEIVLMFRVVLYVVNLVITLKLVPLREDAVFAKVEITMLETAL